MLCGVPVAARATVSKESQNFTSSASGTFPRLCIPGKRISSDEAPKNFSSARGKRREDPPWTQNGRLSSSVAEATAGSRDAITKNKKNLYASLLIQQKIGRGELGAQFSVATLKSFFWHQSMK